MKRECKRRNKGVACGGKTAAAEIRDKLEKMTKSSNKPFDVRLFSPLPIHLSRYRKYSN